MRRKNHYKVCLKIEDRNDIRDNWNTTIKVLYRTNKYHDAQMWCERHSYLHTFLEPDDDGEHWLHIQSMYVEKE